MKPIREMLLKMREELVREIARRSRETAVSGVSDIGDILDSVSEERTRELDMILTDREKMILTDREKQKLKQIDDALDRIEENTYGLCEECGVKIPRARLKVVPFAKHCVECKEAIEREERYTREEPEEAVKKVPMAEAEE